MMASESSKSKGRKRKKGGDWKARAVCWNCQEKGHIRDDCPNPPKDGSKEGESKDGKGKGKEKDSDKSSRVKGSANAMFSYDSDSDSDNDVACVFAVAGYDSDSDAGPPTSGYSDLFGSNSDTVSSSDDNTSVAETDSDVMPGLRTVTNTEVSESVRRDHSSADSDDASGVADDDEGDAEDDEDMWFSEVGSDAGEYDDEAWD
ncbi:hypothetical protein CVT24_012912, partial [Panaeolus cyanescens]